MKRWLSIIGISLLFTLVVYPSAFIYPRDTLPDNNDTRLIAYIIGQVQNNLLEQKPLHFGTFFAPDANTLTYSDLFLTTSLLTLPFRLLTNNPIIILNLAIVIGFTLTTISSYLLFNYLIKDHWTTILLTILFNFSGFHLSYLPHLQIFSLWLVILSVYFYLRFQDSNKIFFLTLFLLTCTAQLAESIFTFYLIFFICFVLFWRKKEQFSKILIQIVFILPLWLSLLFPYLQLHLKYPEAIRPIRDAAHFSLGLEEVFTKYHSWTIIALFVSATLVTKIINVAGVLVKNRTDHVHKSRRESRQRRDEIVTREYDFLRTSKHIIFKPWKLIFLFSLVMSLGPVLKIFGTNLRLFGFLIPLPYSLFYYLFPGFTGFRTPSRFIILALLAAVIIIGYNLKPIFKKLTNKTKFIFILFILTFTLFEADLPLKGYPVNINMHPVYEQVKQLPAEAIILELPIKLWNMPDHQIESIKSLYSLSHKHRRFGGYSGFATNNWIELVEKINSYGLNQENISKLKSLGVTHIVENNTLSPL